jgi:hypothetical protein
MNAGKEKLDALMGVLDQGKTIFYTTPTQKEPPLSMTLKQVNESMHSHKPILQLVGTTLYVLQGRIYVNAEHCRFKIEVPDDRDQYRRVIKKPTKSS